MSSGLTVVANVNCDTWLGPGERHACPADRLVQRVFLPNTDNDLAFATGID